MVCSKKEVQKVDQNCLACKTPSSEMFDSYSRFSFFSHPKTEKSLSTEEVFGNTVNSAPANDQSEVNRP
ncbi:hypothetical protein PsorP6_003902 [Peronosclerospora sorghi]|uniref:Uncharacterized protein n=1 Tax=Peronosclerospora sorghi TaxID=230839 RepID=A0ACC0VQQ6_9STRA|nr:hypothetical protein PsorP6_003902 [Peronosclerospora sorghi]